MHQKYIMKKLYLIFLISILFIETCFAFANRDSYLLYSKEVTLNQKTIDTYEQQFSKFYTNDEPDSILHCIDLLIKEYKINNDTIKILRIYTETCHYLIFGGYIKLASEPLKQFMELAEESGKMNYIANAYLYTAEFMFLGEINLAVALEYFHKSLRIYQSTNNHQNIAYTYFRLGNCYYSTDKEKALNYLLEGINIIEKNQLKVGWYPYRDLAEFYRHQLKDYPNARKYYAKALEKAEKTNNPQQIADILIEQGCLNLQYHKTDSVLPFYNQALQLLLPLQDTSGLVTCSSNVIMSCYSHLGVYYEEVKDYEKALFYHSKVKMNRVLRGGGWMPEPILKVAELESKLGFYKKAAKHYEEFIQLNDSLQQLKVAKDFAKLELKFELEKEEKVNQQKILAKEEIAKSSINKQKAIRNLFILLSLFLFVIIYLLFRNNKNKRKADRKLYEAEMQKLRFFTNISHEIRTPLTLLISPLERIHEIIKKAGDDRLVLLMLRNAEKLKNLVNQLLDISKIDQESIKLHKKTHDFNTLFRTTTAMFQSLGEEKGIAFQVEEEAQDLVFSFDKERIEHVINNLLSNAFKFTARGGKVIAKAEKQDDFLIIRIKDSGIGIPASDINKVFKRFYQTNVSISANYEGTGLGLTIVKEYIELHEGSIRVISELNKGSEFIVKLPLLIQNQEFENNTEPMDETVTEAIELKEFDHESNIANSEKESILIVEDNKDLRAYLKTVFCNSYTILEAPNGEIGEQIALAENPDIIISDVMMPVCDGYQFTESIKTKIETSHIPIILLTAKTNRDDKLMGLHIGADDYILKPFDEKELILKVSNILSTRKTLREKYKKNITVNPSDVEAYSLDEQLLIDITKVIEQNLSDSEFSIEQLCQEVGLSKRHLHRKLKALSDLTPNHFIRLIRLKRASQLLSQKAGSVSEIAYQTGFDNLSYFTKRFKECFHKLPSDYFK